jgi:hypothetical protein
MIKQVRTKSNAYSTVKYDKYGNILTPSRKRELKKAKEEPIKGPESIKIISQYPSTCSVCNNKILVGTQILWNKKNKNTKHVKCSMFKIVIEKYVSRYKKGPNNGRSPKRLETNFMLDPIPWKWTLYADSNIVSYGYTHTEEDANISANQAINQYRPFRA